MANARYLERMVVLCVGITLGCGMLIGRSSSADAPVAMVTDLQGEGQLKWTDHKAQFTILSELAPGVLIDLQPHARLTLVYFKSGGEYTFSGPAQIYIREDQPVALEGAQPAKHALFGSGATEVAIKPLGLAQAGLVMRAAPTPDRLQLIEPVGSKVLDTRPAFQWKPLGSAVKYHLEVTDSAGRILFEADAKGNSFRLPEKARLQPGAAYGWELEATLPDGHRYSSRAEFRIIDPADRALVEKLRPTPGAALSERVAFAALLEQMNLRDAARPYWKKLSEERPNDPTLRRLAAQGAGPQPTEEQE
jgi:hypothetical protein